MSDQKAQKCIKENKLIDARDLPIYPIHYFQRGKTCDLKWIISHMRNIPAHKQREVADEYEKIYGSAKSNYLGRDLANKYLLELSKEYRIRNARA